MNDPIDIPCCCDCGRELDGLYAARDATGRALWRVHDPITDTTVVELICLDCATWGS